MVHTESGEGAKYKPRGRPFVKGNKRGKLENSILADTGCDISDERGIITPNRVRFNKEPLKAEGGYIDIPETTQEEKEGVRTIETIDFNNGENKLSIRFSAVNDRRYRIQIFLNDETEVRPVTYQGSSSGYSFWKLLKGIIKK